MVGLVGDLDAEGRGDVRPQEHEGARVRLVRAPGARLLLVHDLRVAQGRDRDLRLARDQGVTDDPDADLPEPLATTAETAVPPTSAPSSGSVPKGRKTRAIAIPIRKQIAHQLRGAVRVFDREEEPH